MVGSSRWLGLALFSGTFAWVVVAARRPGSDAGPTLLLLVGSALAFSLGIVAARADRRLAAMVVVGAGAALIALRPASVLTRAPAGGLFGYPNARGALYTLATLAALSLAAGTTGRVRLAMFIIAGAFAVVPIVVGARTATVLLFTFPFMWIAAGRRGARVVCAVVAAMLAAAIAGTAVLGFFYRPGTSVTADRIVHATLSERRPMLWHDAETLMRRAPLLGIGPGRFQVTSPIARSDRDARWAHNEFLQFGAETGWPGFLALLAIFAWIFAGIARDSAGLATAIGAVVVGTAGMLASVDYVFHFAAIPLAAALLAGGAAATHPPNRSESRRNDGDRVP